MSKHVMFQGRNVPVEGFRSFVYGPNNTQKLANNYDEYTDLISSGLWFSKPEAVPTPKGKSKRGE